LRRGQPEARAELFRLYAPQVRRILYLQGFCEEVDDAVQEVFIKVYRAEIPREEAFLAWFTGSSSTPARPRSLAQDPLRPDGQAAASRSRGDGRSTVRAGRPRAAGCAEAAGQLRECVALRFFADLPLEEIAKARTSVGTVKSRLHGAAKKLRAALDEQGYERE
jgi:DNA-directed RNA polymerase specialized sigma24 family protein